MITGRLCIGFPPIQTLQPTESLLRGDLNNAIGFSFSGCNHETLPIMILQVDEPYGNRRRLIILRRCTLMEVANLVIVDDTSPAIKYDSSWRLYNNEGATLGQTGGALYNTLHGTKSHTKFTFTYNGTLGSLFVVGTTRTGSPSSWNCTVDKKSIPNFQPKEPANHFKMCGTTASPGVKGNHTLQFEVNPLGGEQIFFDYILYTPEPESGPEDLVFDSNNTQLQYSQHWVSTSLGHVTSTAGEKLEFDFKGYSLTWFGFLEGNAAGNASATYSLDGVDPITFIVDTNKQSALTDLVFFQTPTLDLANHHLEVVFQGSSDGIPLSLNRIVVQNDTFGIRLTPTPLNTIGSRMGATLSTTSATHGEPIATSSVNSETPKPALSTTSGIHGESTPSKPTPSVNIQTHKPALNSNSGIIAGIIIGLVAVSICTAILIRRRMRRRINDSRPEPFQHTPTAVEQQSSIRRPRKWAERTTFIFRSNLGSSTETASGPPNRRRPPRLLLHQDSGVRVPQPDEESEIIEVPPTYGSLEGK
ncbi:hypothetical protein GALMADRAFT_1345117 [Galerina marginata CBS 339.88]|uniref:Uncharacterized protein n=1 Tax=Galerina marginata (strain CBS 339.88) TaxID=685588 RepID=A0A067SUY7_GALM3|nr:hypothetical protein GALMADRAFT_1345117 [Galerina marginata CBS 339.88]